MDISLLVTHWFLLNLLITIWLYLGFDLILILGFYAAIHFLKYYYLINRIKLHYIFTNYIY
jgi:hypothetical protein